jgi:hypothetical protein
MIDAQTHQWRPFFSLSGLYPEKSLMIFAHQAIV